MLLAWPFFFFAANCFSRNAAEQFSTVRLRIAENGLRFFSKIAHHIVDDEIWKITFPQITIPIEDGPGTGEVNTTELTLRRFKSPIFSFKLTPPNGISWQSKGGSAELDAIWLLRYYFIAPIYLSGYIRAKMDNIRVYMETNLLVRDEHPQIEVTDCSVDIRKLNVYITGGVLQWIINLFRAQLAVVIKQTIHQEKNPIAMSKYIEGEMVFDVMYGKDECVLPTKQMDSEVHSTKRMAYVWMSEYIPNCLLQTVYNNENLTFAITPSTSGGRFAGFLRTNCGFFEICIGKFLPTLRLRYPNRIVFFFIRLAGAPYTIIDANNIRIFANSTVDLYLPSEKQQQSQRLARLVMNSTIYAIPAISHRKLVGTISNVMIILHEQDSVIGHFSFQTLKFLEKVLAKAVKLFGGTALKIGVPLPLIDSVTISDDAQIITKNGYLHLDFDFIYG
ncbi:unnamed protein product [Onchocerca ochengi]|uniref:BPI2 domain-containing protein n=1 Tax=Onchocerca ochengi TaxID=42157 RepID=A0A182DYX7_ONCOC|nr:unnamed protein product [Onchocerca ochengi]